MINSLLLPLTREQRAKVYLQAAKYIEKPYVNKGITQKQWTPCCWAIEKACVKLLPEIFGRDYSDVDFGEFRYFFPEFMLFANEGVIPTIYWWQPRDTTSRVIALLLAREMALNP